MSASPPAPPRARSAFAAAFLSLIFPGLGHAYAGALSRGLAFAAIPFLGLALLAGVALRADRLELVGFVIQREVLIALLVLNAIALVYRLVAVVDAWQVARFLNAVDASGGGRLGRAKLPLNPISAAGLIAVVLVIAGGHVAFARYNVLALDLVNCVFTDEGSAECEPEETAEPGDSGAPSAEPSAGASPTDVVPTPIGSASGETPAPTLPPWDGKERLNILLIGADQRRDESTFNTDTLIVVSIDPATRQVAMFQIPRDTVDVPVPANARGLWGSVYGGKINSWWTQNRNRTELWPGRNAAARGYAALKGILGELYDLEIRYYVQVNFDGFRNAIDTLGGVQINVQIPVSDDSFPAGGGSRRVYIPAGPQQMTGGEALIYARSRHGAQFGDFDRGRRQQRVLLSLQEQMNVQAIFANLTELVTTLKKSVKTDVPTDQVAKLLALADDVDTKDVRSFVFAPPFYATEHLQSDRGYIITPNVRRIRAAVRDAFTSDPALEARRERLGVEQAHVWVLNQSGRNGLAASSAEYLAFDGLDASAPNQRPEGTIRATRIVVYNGAEAGIPETIAYLEDLFDATVTTATDRGVTVDVVVTLGRNAPDLEIQAPG